MYDIEDRDNKIMRGGHKMKKTFLDELLRLTKLQKEALEAENVDEFAKLIEEKQVCIDQINEVTNGDSSVLDNEERAILLETAEIDKQNRVVFDSQFEEVKLQLRKIRDLKKRETFYANPYDQSHEEGVFFDKK